MSATKFLCVIPFSDNVVRHSLAYLTVHKMDGGRPLLPVIFGQNDLTPAKTVTGKSIKSFPMSLR